MQKYFKFFLAYYFITFSLFGIPAHAQQNYVKSVICAKTEQVIKTLTGKEYEEKPIWMGVDDKEHTFSIFFNKATSAWTLIEFKGNVACILGAGNESQVAREFKKH